MVNLRLQIKLKMDELRSTIMAQEDLIASKRRFGLFSQPPPLAVGDDGPYTKRKISIGQNGKPKTNPPQMLGGPARSGMTKSAYFIVPSSILLNDPYKQRYRIEAQFDKKLHKRSPMHESQFIPSSGPKTLSNSSYPYMDQNPQSSRRKPILRDQMGKLKIGQRNFTTNSIKKVQSQLFKPTKYMSDPYDMKLELQKKQKQIFKTKLMQGRFNPTDYGNKLFVKDSLVYGQDAKAKLILNRRKSSNKSILSIYHHQMPFSPARGGHGDPFNKYPQRVEKKLNEQISPGQIIKDDDKDKQKWVPTSIPFSRPTPSISLNPMNLGLRKYK